MLEFTDGEWFYIAGRGNIFVTKMPSTVEGSLLGTEVKIRGFIYYVLGIEKTAKNDGTLYKDRSLGILVRGRVLESKEL